MVWNNVDINHTVEKEIVSWANKQNHGIFEQFVLAFNSLSSVHKGRVVLFVCSEERKQSRAKA